LLHVDIMITAQWTCRRCAKALLRPASLRSQLVRLASTNAEASLVTTLPPALLQRARSMAAEHATLAATLEDSFDSKAARRLGELSRVADALKEFEEAQASKTELTSLLDSPDGELRQLANDELASTNENLAALTTALSATLTPKDPFAHMPCLVEIRPGPGGMEGRYFADVVFRMYKAYCARRGLRTNVVNYETVEGAETSGGGANSEMPLAEAVLEIQDADAYEMFRGEAGMHRVQRVPATEKQGRTHTSAVAVWVLPSFPVANESALDQADQDFNDPTSDFYIDVKDVKQEKMRSGGPGGQHANKTESAIRLTHIPTGIVVSIQDSRSQHRNRDEAWRLLRSRIAQQRREEKEEQASSLRNSVLSKDKITRGAKIRTYNYQQDRCTDHRANIDVHNLPDVLAGGETLDRLMDGAKEWLVAREIRALIAEEEEAQRADAASKETRKASTNGR
jgi:peptide chain release factor 1